MGAVRVQYTPGYCMACLTSMDECVRLVRSWGGEVFAGRSVTVLLVLQVTGRDKEVARVIQILARRSKNNPLLLGEPGVGKTAIAEGALDTAQGLLSKGAAVAGALLPPAQELGGACWPLGLACMIARRWPLWVLATVPACVLA